MPIDARHPREIRRDLRNGKLTGITAGLGANHVQANLAVLPRDYAYDFLLFCQRNPRPCPLLEVTDVGSAEPVGVAPGADLRTDIPRYRIYTHGELTDEVTDRSEEHTSELQSHSDLVCRLLLEKKKKKQQAKCNAQIITQSK